MTQPVEFTTEDLCAGYASAADKRRALLAALRKPPKPLPRREPGKYAHDKVWQVKV